MPPSQCGPHQLDPSAPQSGNEHVCVCVCVGGGEGVLTVHISTFKVLGRDALEQIQARLLLKSS